jgi:uncharacterized protein (TIGR00255 family)
MPFSMTGYARTQTDTDRFSMTVVVRGVNHRFLDMQLRLSAELEGFETGIRRIVKERVGRGQLQITATLKQTASGTRLEVNRPLVDSYLAAYREVADERGITGEPDLNSILRIPGAVVLSETANGESAPELEKTFFELLESALAEFNETRRREAEGIIAEMKTRAADVLGGVRAIETEREGVLPLFRDRLEKRLTDLVGQAGIEPQRILQEAAVLADRSDISEELQRLAGHAERLLQLLGENGPLGKQIDFLAQEMNREANTILSKSTPLGQAGMAVTEHGLRVKAEIEKIREQTQNLE